MSPMKITEVTPFILHVPVTRKGISDSMHNITHWGAPGVIIDTDAGEALWFSAAGNQFVRLGQPLERPAPKLEAIPDWLRA